MMARFEPNGDYGVHSCDGLVMRIFLSRRFKLRVWLGVRLLWLVSKVMGCDFILEDEDD